MKPRCLLGPALLAALIPLAAQDATDAGTNDYRRRMEAIYESRLAAWPVAFETMRVETRFGETHLIAGGPRDGYPVILLHPFGFNGTYWADTIEPLSRKYRTYCVDTIGDMGRSPLKSGQPFPRNAKDYCLWLEDVCRRLNIEKAHFIGLSMGGWLANAMGLYNPDLVAKLVLCAPAAGIPDRVVWDKLLQYMILQPTEDNLAKLVRFILGEGRAYEVLSDYFFLAVHRRDVMITPPFPFSDEQLASLRMPVLLMVGDGEVVWKSIDQTLERGRRLIPSLKTVVIPAAGHALTVDQPERVNREIMAFLEDERDEKAP